MKNHKNITLYTLKLNPKNLLKLKKNISKNKKNYSFITEKKIKDKALINKNYSDQNIKIITKNLLINALLNKNYNIKNKYKNIYPTKILQKRKNHLILRKAKSHNLKKNTKFTNENPIIAKKNSSLFEISYKKQKTEDIVQGLPKIEQLLEIKKVSKFKHIPNNPEEKLRLFSSKFKTLYTPNIAIRKSIQKLQKYLITKIQQVYISQGVIISDKHLEVIIKQMTSKVMVTEGNDSPFITGEIVELNRMEKNNLYIKKKAKYEPIVLGISKIAKASSSFISQASFQETIKTLSNAAVKGNTDWLQGLKENIILGNLIPAGTNETGTNTFYK